MYGLRKETDISFLQGLELLQIAVGRYQVIFAFEGGVSVTVEGSYELRLDGEVTLWTPGETRAAGASLALLGRSVENASGQEDGTLILAFSDKDILRILDSSKEFESYQVTGAGHTIVV